MPLLGLHVTGCLCGLDPLTLDDDSLANLAGCNRQHAEGTGVVAHEIRCAPPDDDDVPDVGELADDLGRDV